jgi:ABC-type spermidine/putrescine transport system permease subunit II
VKEKLRRAIIFFIFLPPLLLWAIILLSGLSTTAGPFQKPALSPVLLAFFNQMILLLIILVITALISLLLALFLFYAIRQFPALTLLRSILNFLDGMPSLVLAFSLALAYSSLLQNFSIFLTVLAFVIWNIPTATISLYNSFAGLSELQRPWFRSLPSRPWPVLRYCLLPTVLNTSNIATLLRVCRRVLGSVVIYIILTGTEILDGFVFARGGKLLSTDILKNFTPSASGHPASLYLLFGSGCALFVVDYLFRRRRKES